ncbi:MAG: hypothetical protein J6Q53_00805 [Oscillospiraceae bacterium]|nr:hypothetical protein [Oscillospiraceae bacterium]
MEFTAPPVPEAGADFLPDEPETFAQGLWMIVREAVDYLQPSLAEAAGVCMCLIAAIMLLSLAQSLPGASERITNLIGTLTVAVLMLQPASALISLGVQTVTELSEYGKLLLPVMTAAVAAQGGAVTSAALYTGTVLFDALLSSAISQIIVPMVYVFLALSIANSAVGEGMLGKLRDFIKWLMTWSLKIILYIFTGYISITGVVSGTADAAAIKAAKLTISGMVPVVGSILSDASETILVSAGVMKSAVGVYGLLAVLAVWIGPFVRIGVQYILLKVTGAVCGVFGAKQPVSLILDFTKAMGMLLAMTSAVCLLLLISTVCLMKGVG